MNLPANTHLAYTVWAECWYSQVPGGPQEHPNLIVSASTAARGVAWAFQIDGCKFRRSPVTRVTMLPDAYAAFAQVPEFFSALAERQPVTLDDVRAILDALGAVDETPRVSPYAEHAES
jgi:hypothetical protein